MQAIIYSVASVIAVSLISLVGAFTISIKSDKLKSLLHFLVSFAVGALFGDAFIHLIPQAYEKLGLGALVSFLVMLGIILFFILEKFIRWRHCHIPTSVSHPHPVVFMNLVGDGVHNLIDGMIIGASYLAGIQIGIATTLAVILHEIPQEMGDFGILVHGGIKKERALLLNFLSGLFAVLGTVLALMIGPFVENFALYVLPVTAGGFIYMAGSDLIPELHDQLDAGVSFWQLVCILAGILVMAALLFLE